MNFNIFLLQTVKQIKTSTHLNVTVCIDKNQCDKTNCRQNNNQQNKIVKIKNKSKD